MFWRELGQRGLILTILLIIFMACFENTGCRAASLPERERRVTILFLDRINFDDLNQYAGVHLQTLIQEGALALMNVNTAGRPGTAGGYVTIGAGARGQGDEVAGLAFEIQEEYSGFSAGQLFHRHTGEEPGDRAILFPFQSYLKLLNMSLDYTFSPGALGGALKKAGRKTALIGNADTGRPGRQAVTVAMDETGRVDYGYLGSEVITGDPDYPYGFFTDPAKIWTLYNRLPEDASLIVLEWGDTFRLDDYRKNLTPRRTEELMSLIFNNLDLFLALLGPTLGPDHLLMIVAPSPPKRMQGTGRQLTPVLLAGGETGSGLALSATTRRPGLITNIDLAPTILSFYGITPAPSFFGSPVISRPADNCLSYLREEEARIAGIYEQRPVLLKSYVFLQIIVVIGSLAGLLARFRPVIHLRYLLVALMIVPFSLLVLPWFPYSFYAHLFFSFFSVIGITTVVTIFLCRSRLGFKYVFMIIGFLTTGLIIFDLLRGGIFLRASFLSYDPIGGARFYGVGNEYMGVFIGAAILGTTAFFTWFSSDGSAGFAARKQVNKKLLFVFTGAVFFIILFLMASPSYGANFGGTLTALFAFLVTFLGLQSQKISLQRLLIIFILFLTATFLFLVLLNIVMASEVSHLGRTWELVRSEGLGEILKIIRRKMNINLKLIRYSVWSRILLTLLGLQVILFNYPVGLLADVRQKELPLFSGFTGILTGSIVALFVNDSGVVAAATLLLFGAIPMLLLMLEERF